MKIFPLVSSTLLCIVLLIAACGDNSSEKNFNQPASSQQVPEENKFQVTVLDKNLNEPVDLAVMKDGSGRVLLG